MRPAVAGALTALTLSGAAFAAGSDIRAAEHAVADQLPKGTHPYFSATFETQAGVCGVVSASALPGDADRRFAVALATDSKGHRKPGQVSIDTGSAPDFPAVWAALCAAP